MAQVETPLLGLNSFEAGTIAALHALKFALQNSPGFNNDLLVDVLRHYLNNPSNEVNREQFEAPILALLHDHVLTGEGKLKVVPVSRS